MPGSRVENKSFVEKLGFGLELTPHGGLEEGERKRLRRECGQRRAVENDCGPFSNLTLICEQQEKNLMRVLDDRTLHTRSRNRHFILQASCFQGGDVCLPRGTQRLILRGREKILKAVCEIFFSF